MMQYQINSKTRNSGQFILCCRDLIQINTGFTAAVKIFLVSNIRGWLLVVSTHFRSGSMTRNIFVSTH